MTAEETIVNMLGKPYVATGDDHKHICWSFCREIYSLLGIRMLPLDQMLDQIFPRRDLCRVEEPKITCVVLFHVVVDWHAGIVWPDGLHFIHASPKNILNPKPTEYVVCKDSLTAWPYRQLVEGYYWPGIPRP